jgi:hypothetical protein
MNNNIQNTLNIQAGSQGPSEGDGGAPSPTGGTRDETENALFDGEREATSREEIARQAEAESKLRRGYDWLMM